MESKLKKIILPFFVLFLYAEPKFQTGDIILRKEQNTLSNLFSQIDPCGYSHSGIIIIKNKTPYVVHIEYDTRKDLKITPLKQFLLTASSYRVLKPKFNINRHKLTNLIYSLKNSNIKFDTALSLNNNSFYCTEFVDYVYYRLINKHIYSYLYTFKNKKIITVRSILKSKYFKNE